MAAAEGRLNAARAVADKTQRGFRTEDIAQARAEFTLADGQLKEAEARWAEREVRSPAAAVVETLDLRPGRPAYRKFPRSAVARGRPAVPDGVCPGNEDRKCAVGQERRKFVSILFPDETFQAHVEQIRQQSEFLPRNVQTKEERVHQVIGVKLRVENRDNRCVPA